MDHPKPLFVLGNKRSGSTLLVNMLNVHPKICITHESDVLWILYQSRSGKPTEYKCYPTDAPRGMYATLNACEDILESQLYKNPSKGTIRGTFYGIHKRIATQGSQMHGPLKKGDWLWCGDKKPVQQSDPILQQFIREYFPDARFLHLVRNPVCVVASMLEAARTWNIVPDFWKTNAENVLRQWAIHEQWVQDAKASKEIPVHTLRLEDLSTNPVEQISRICAFLDLEMPGEIVDDIANYTYATPNEKHKSFSMPLSSEAVDLMKTYGYL